MLWILVRSSVPLNEKYPQTITEPLPCFTVGEIQADIILSSDVRRAFICLFESKKKFRFICPKNLRPIKRTPIPMLPHFNLFIQFIFFSRSVFTSASFHNHSQEILSVVVKFNIASVVVKFSSYLTSSRTPISHRNKFYEQIIYLGCY